MEAWVGRAVVTSALKIRRARRAKGGGDVPDEAVEPPPTETAAVRRAVSALPERERLILFLNYYADLDYETIADTLQISPGTVGAALHSARTAIRARLEKEVLIHGGV